MIEEQPGDGGVASEQAAPLADGAPVGVRPGFEAAGGSGRALRPGQQEVQRAMQAVGAVGCARWSTQHFHGNRLLGEDLEQLVDVAEAGRPHRDAVLEHEEGTAGARAGEYRRADCRQAFLLGATLEPGAGGLRTEFRRMGGANQVDARGVDDRRIADQVELGDRFTGGGDDDPGAECSGFAGCRDASRRQRYQHRGSCRRAPQRPAAHRCG